MEADRPLTGLAIPLYTHMRLTAQEARNIAGSSAEQKRREIEEACNATLEQIEDDIKEAASEGKTEIEYRWSFAGDKHAPLSRVFPKLTQTPMSWDGGDGRSSEITETGAYLKTQLEANGFYVMLYDGCLTVSWK